jgi:Fic family protein
MSDTGKIRETQVFIGERELGIEQSRFVPVPEGQLLQDGISDWEKWINDVTHQIPLLVKAAVVHYQFETLHPFSDGNGRLGRLVVVLQMMEAGTLAYPVLGLSPWLKQRKEEYKSSLREVSITGDFDPWVRFFATAVEAQAADMVQRIEELLAVREELLQIVRDNRKHGLVVDIIEDLIGYLSLTPTSTAERHGVTYNTANDAFSKLEKMGILRETTGAKYGRIFVCPRVRRIVTRPSVFHEMSPPLQAYQVLPVLPARPPGPGPLVPQRPRPRIYPPTSVACLLKVSRTKARRGDNIAQASLHSESGPLPELRGRVL